MFFFSMFGVEGRGEGEWNIQLHSITRKSYNIKNVNELSCTKITSCSRFSFKILRSSVCIPRKLENENYHH